MSDQKQVAALNALETALFIDPITGDNIINQDEANQLITLSGSVIGVFTPGDTIIVTIGEDTYTTIVEASGQWSLTVEGQALAENPSSSIEATLEAHDENGDVFHISTQAEYIVDKADADIPLTLEVFDDVGPYVGFVPEGGVTDDVSPTFLGSAPANETVTLILNGEAIGSVQSDLNGNWHYRVDLPLTDGAYSVQASVNVDGAVHVTPPYSFFVDTVAELDDQSAIGFSDVLLDVVDLPLPGVDKEISPANVETVASATNSVGVDLLVEQAALISII